MECCPKPRLTGAEDVRSLDPLLNKALHRIFKPQQHTRLTSDDNEEDGQFMKNIKSQETLPVIQPVKEEKKGEWL